MNDDGKRAGEYDWGCIAEGVAVTGVGIGIGWAAGVAGSGLGSGGMIRLGGCFAEVGAGRGGGFEVATRAGMSISRPKNETRYRLNANPTTIRNKEKTSRFLFKPGEVGAVSS